jgi:hypothetical protein
MLLHVFRGGARISWAIVQLICDYWPMVWRAVALFAFVAAVYGVISELATAGGLNLACATESLSMPILEPEYE